MYPVMHSVSSSGSSAAAAFSITSFGMRGAFSQYSSNWSCSARISAAT